MLDSIRDSFCVGLRYLGYSLNEQSPEALDDVKHGRVTHYDSVDDMFRSVLGEEAFSKLRSQHV